jgi:hypothetical protein
MRNKRSKTNPNLLLLLALFMFQFCVFFVLQSTVMLSWGLISSGISLWFSKVLGAKL